MLTYGENELTQDLSWVWSLGEFGLLGRALGEYLTVIYKLIIPIVQELAPRRK